MNIFAVDIDPAIAAQSLYDRHINKMIVESSQLLANCYSEKQLMNAPKTQSLHFRKHSYYNHPCSKWVRQYRDNFDWLLCHASYLCHEKLYRFENYHFCADFINWCRENSPELKYERITPFFCAMPNDYKLPCPFDDERGLLISVMSYRNYYVAGKRHLAGYTRRNTPYWM